MCEGSLQVIQAGNQPLEEIRMKTQCRLTSSTGIRLQGVYYQQITVGYISIDALEKFLGELHDFIPGSSGYLAYHVQNEINMSAIKNKLRRKLS
ncbi:Telomere repeats-binding bouquet formation protein 2 [Apodemus speciosus]|uniref:Telomere repeats-binding bouquet formation protein 2 n=1 Tax=Apodemus speciosus TaxID=105296 RepID=A0ABQ0EIX2_APOSI